MGDYKMKCYENGVYRDVRPDEMYDDTPDDPLVNEEDYQTALSELGVRV